MLVHTSSAEMPVMLSSQVKTMPSPQIVVRKVRQANPRDNLATSAQKYFAVWTGIKTIVAHSKAGTGTPRLFTHPNIRGAYPSLARDRSIRELA